MSLYDPRDFIMLIAWLITALSASAVAVVLALGIRQNHVEGHFRAMMSAVFMISGLQSFFGFDKVLLRSEHIWLFRPPPLLTDDTTIVSTLLLAAAWTWLAYMMVTYGKPMKRTITKEDCVEDEKSP